AHSGRRLRASWTWGYDAENPMVAAARRATPRSSRGCWPGTPRPQCECVQPGKMGRSAELPSRRGGQATDRHAGGASHTMPYHRADEAVRMTQMATRGMQAGTYRTRRSSRWLVTIVVIVAVLVGLDFGARAAAENMMANKIQQQGLQSRPSVSIGG